MKIEVRKLKLGLITQGSDIIHYELLKYLLKQAYPDWCDTYWQPLPGRPTMKVLRPSEVDLQHMARILRGQGWCAYYWRDRYGLDNVEDYNNYINYGRREGIIIGRYCPNLTAWLLSHT